MWQARDTDAIETLIRAVTDDHAVALVTFQGTTITGQNTKFEIVLMPLRHNGSTSARILGAMTALDEPYWLGTQPVVEQKITGLRLIWPDDPSVAGANTNDTITFPEKDAAIAGVAGHVAVPARVLWIRSPPLCAPGRHRRRSFVTFLVNLTPQSGRRPGRFCILGKNVRKTGIFGARAKPS